MPGTYVEDEHVEHSTSAVDEPQRPRGAPAVLTIIALCVGVYIAMGISGGPQNVRLVVRRIKKERKEKAEGTPFAR